MFSACCRPLYDRIAISLLLFLLGHVVGVLAWWSSWCMGDNSHSWQCLLSTLAIYSLYSLDAQCSRVVPPCLVGQSCEPW